MTSSVELVPGTVVNHRYHVQRVLGRGGCGRTYLAIDRCRFNELCVLKEFVPNSQGDPVVASKLRQLFRREAAILHKLDHPQIPKFYAGFELDDRLFIVQEFIDGKTYWKQLQERRRQGETFTEREIIPWLRSLLELLDYLHGQKIVHRDISPDNIMLSNKRNLPVLIDFGVVKQTAHSELVPYSSGLIQASVAVGKVGYAPYEQIRMGQCSPRSDLYALAVTAVVLLTGQSPHLLMNPKTLDWQWHHRVRLDRRFRQILDCMMAERPTDRYPSARAVLQDLALLHANSRHWSRNSLPWRSSTPNPSSTLNGTVRARTNRAAQPEFTLLQSSMSMVPISSQTTQIEPTASETKISCSQITTLPFSEISVPLTDLDSLPSGQSGSITSITPCSKIWVREKSPWFERSVSQTLMLASLLLLPIAGILVGIQSPHIAPLCQPLQNCAGLESTERYRQAIEQAVSAKALMGQAQTVLDLQRARDRLSESLAQLSVLTANPQVQPEAVNLIRQYQSVFQGLEVYLEREARAEQLLHRAAAEAQQAIEQSRTARTPQQLMLAKRQWQKAVATLKAIPDRAFVTQQAKARSEEYLNRLKAIDLRLASMTPDKPQLAQGQDLKVPQPATAQVTAGGIGSVPVQPQLAIAPPARTSQSSQSQPTPQTSRPAQTRRSPQPSRTAARPTSNPRSANRSIAAPRYAMTSSRPSQVFIWIDQASIHPDGTPVARLRIINDSDRPFSFSPVYAEVQTAGNQTFRSRVLLTSTSPTILQPGESMSGSVSLLDRNWSALQQPMRATLIIQERASGDRVFHIPLPMNL